MKRPSNFHPALIDSMQAANFLSDSEADRIVNIAEQLVEGQAFIKAVQRMPLSAMKAGIGFIQKYFGEYPHCQYLQRQNNRHEFQCFRFNENVKEGVGINLSSSTIEVFRFGNVNGIESVISRNKNTLL